MTVVVFFDMIKKDKIRHNITESRVGMRKGPKTTVIGFCICAVLLSGIFLASSGLFQKDDEEYVPAVATFGYNEVLTVENVSGKAEKQDDVISASEKNSHDAETDFSGNIKIDINKATCEELQLIDGIGPVLAENIVNYRDEHGNFSSMGDLLNVKGIGDSKLEKIKLHSYIDGEDIRINEDKNEEKYTETLPPESEEEHTETAEALWDEPEVAEIIDYWEEDDFSYEDDGEQKNGNDDIQIRYPLDLNSATAEQLMTIKGIGQKTAARIVLYAQAYGFYSVEDLIEVEGIGKSAYEQIKPYVCADTSKLPLPLKWQTSVTTPIMTTATTKYIPKLPIELNNAALEDLMWLDGIGYTIAIRIISYGQQNGFYSVDDLLKVNGIGQSKFNTIKEYLCVDISGLPPQTTVPTETVTMTTTIGGKINLNTCTAEDLKSLGIISDEMADEIINFRGEIKYYSNIEELNYINGMTLSIFNTIILYVYV